VEVVTELVHEALWYWQQSVERHTEAAIANRRPDAVLSFVLATEYPENQQFWQEDHEK
jgi:hypothetical protein